MANKQIRLGQIIAPFGPGSIYTDRRGVPHVVCGLDHWFKRWDETQGMLDCKDRAEFEITEPRLSGLLHVDRFCKPPDFRPVARDTDAPPNALLYVPAQRFPRWHYHSETGKLDRFNLWTRKIENPEGGGRLRPVRFVAVCAAGHLCEFPWKEWIGCQCETNDSLVLRDRGGSELTSVTVQCENCKRIDSLAGSTSKPAKPGDGQTQETSAFQRKGISCPGDRPWLGEGACEAGCGEVLIGALINQSNLYFPKTISAIYLPDLNPMEKSVVHLRNEINQDRRLGTARTVWRMPDRPFAVEIIQKSLELRQIKSDPKEVEQALESLFDFAGRLPQAQMAQIPAPKDPESEILVFRRAEFNILRSELDDPDRSPDLRIIPATVPDELSPWFDRVRLVERLRETRVFFGFDRLESSKNPLAGMPDQSMVQLFRHPPEDREGRWLPAVKVYGEGIYLELKEAQIAKWQTDHASWIEKRLDDGFVARLGSIFQTIPPLAAANRAWASRYLLVHTLAHILINQLVFECGYSTASLRERLYISADPAAPMAGFLVYTAAGDSEGTLGGLVRLGHPERLGQVLERALSRAAWCSADPVCSEHLGGQGSVLANLAACHACVLLPETSCETINQGLDRSMVVGTPDYRDLGFLASLVSTV
jgi:hypothetical protein